MGETMFLLSSLLVSSALATSTKGDYLHSVITMAANHERQWLDRLHEPFKGGTSAYPILVAGQKFLVTEQFSIDMYDINGEGMRKLGTKNFEMYSSVITEIVKGRKLHRSGSTYVKAVKFLRNKRYHDGESFYVLEKDMKNLFTRMTKKGIDLLEQANALPICYPIPLTKGERYQATVKGAKDEVHKAEEARKEKERRAAYRAAMIMNGKYKMKKSHKMNIRKMGKIYKSVSRTFKQDSEIEINGMVNSGGLGRTVGTCYRAFYMKKGKKRCCLIPKETFDRLCATDKIK